MCLKRLFTVLLLLAVWPAMAAGVGDKAPNIFGKHIDGSLYKLSAQAAKPRVINFFWVECVPCREEIPLLAQKAQAYPHVDFVVVHAQMNAETETNYNISDIKEFVATLAAYPENIVLGNDRLKAADLYDIPAFPMTVLLNKQGVIEKRLISYNETTVKQLEQWLSQQ